MPKLWTETIAAHRREVGDAILDTTVDLVARHGMRAVTMSQIAEATGIGRATLYKYFPDVESILAAWHERQVAVCLAQLAEIRDQTDEPIEQLRAVLAAYARIRYERHEPDLGPLLHRGKILDRAHEQLGELFTGILSRCREAGVVRADSPPEELARYCLHALGAAATLPTDESVRRLVGITLAGLQAR